MCITYDRSDAMSLLRFGANCKNAVLARSRRPRNSRDGTARGEVFSPGVLVCKHAGMFACKQALLLACLLGC